MMELVKSFTFGEEIGEKVAVKFSAEGTVVKATSETDNVCGVTLFAGKQGAMGDVLMLGLGKVVTSGSVTAGDFLVATTGGKMKALDVENMEGAVVVAGRVLETASSAAHLSAIINPQVMFIPEKVEEEEQNNENV